MEFPFRNNLAKKNYGFVQWLELYHLPCKKVFGIKSSPQKAELSPEQNSQLFPDIEPTSQFKFKVLSPAHISLMEGAGVLHGAPLPRGCTFRYPPSTSYYYHYTSSSELRVVIGNVQAVLVP